jgi:hypothetical protein
LAANIPERKTVRRIRGQARSYKIFLSKPRIVGMALAANIPERRNSKYQPFRQVTSQPTSALMQCAG